MDTNIFSMFDPQGESEGSGGEDTQFAGGNQEFNVEGEAPSAQPPVAAGGEEQPGGEEQQKPPTVQVSKEEWDNTQRMLAEFKGFMAASQNRQPDAPPQPQAAPQPQVDPRQQQAQLDQLAEALGNEVITNPKEGVKKILMLGAQIAAAQAAQYSAPAQSTTADLIIENFVTRKAAKDELFDKGVGERFEQRLKQIDPRVLAGASRAQINAALEELYDAEAGRWAREQYTEAQKRRSTVQRQEPTNYGGGRSNGGSAGGGQRRTTIPDSWKAFALSAGIPESEITPELFSKVDE